MRKSFKTYLIIWILALILFNLIIFVIPSTFNGATIIDIASTVSLNKSGIAITNPKLVELSNNLINNPNKDLLFNKYGGAFWPCYTFIILAFIGQLICAYYALKETNKQKLFYKIPIITISYTGLMFILLFGIIGMFFPNFPIWLAVIICITIFIITMISLLKADLVANIISSKDNEIAESTTFMKEMTVKAKALWDADKDNDDLRKLYEAFRYANPIIGNELLKKEICDKLNKLENENSLELIIELIKIIK